MEGKDSECCGNKEKCSNDQPKEVKGKIQKEREAQKDKRRRQKPPTDVCFKCKKQPDFKYRNNLVICSTCFKYKIVETKFRSSLRNDLNVRGKDGNKVLVFVSGGINSLCLGFMTAESLRHNNFSGRKMFFDAELLHVDESCFYNDLTDESKKANSARLTSFAEECEMKLNVINIEETLGMKPGDARKIIEAAKNRGSCREDLVKMLRDRAIYKFVIKNDFQRLSFGDGGLRAASNAFNALIKGRGKNFIEETAKRTTFMGDENIIQARPIRELLPRELEYYAQINNLEQYVVDLKPLAHYTKGKTGSLPGRGDFTAVIDSFLSNLQKGYPSTIYTVVKTSEKVKIIKELDDAPICPMCKTKKDEIKVLESGLEKELVGATIETLDLSVLQKLHDDTLTPLEKTICYGCTKILENSKKEELLELLPLN